jgi:hypothetical protein
MKYKLIINLLNMKKIIYIIISLAVIFWQGCKEEGRLDHIDESAPAPGKVTVSEVINTAGGAIIRFQIPKDENLLGVKAVYERNGEVCEAKASAYVDTLTVEGFGDTRPRRVDLYGVGVNGKLSDSVSVTVYPLEPPVLTASKEMWVAFGGVGIAFSNPARSNLAITLMADTTGTNEWKAIQTFYTKADTGVYYQRGMDPKEYRFALFMRDRWNNCSDTLVRTITPLEETSISKSKFSCLRLPDDFYHEMSPYVIERAWDGSLSSFWASAVVANEYITRFPRHFTISMGCKAVISRMKLYTRSSDAYKNQGVRRWQLWGSDNPPTDGSWNNWHLLGEWEVFKPSGYEPDGAVGTITQEDINYAVSNGAEAEVLITEQTPSPYIPVTHLRIRIMKAFDPQFVQGQTIITELEFWGQLQDE